MLPVVAGLVTIEQACMTSHQHVLDMRFDPVRIKMDGYLMVGQMAGYGIAVALYAHQASTGDACQYFDIAIEWGRHGHQINLLLFEDVGDGNAGIFRMPHSRPQSATAYFKPGIQLIERAEALLPGIQSWLHSFEQRPEFFKWNLC